MTEETMKWLFNNGLAILVLVAIAYAVAKGWRAFFAMVLVPLKDAAIAHLQSTTVHLDKTGETMDKMNTTMERVCTELSDCRKDVAEIKSKTEVCHRAHLPNRQTA